MSIESVLFSGLTAQPAVSSAIGTRLYPAGERPQGAALPAVTYQRISTPIVSGFRRGVIARSPRFQFTCLAETHDACAALMVTIGTALLALTSGSGITFGSITLDSERGPYLVPDVQLYRGEVDALLLYQGV